MREDMTQQIMCSSLNGKMLISQVLCQVVGRGFLRQKCVHGTRPVSAHPLGAI